MSRPKKPGFDSFDLTAEFFTDPNVRNLHSSLGSDAVLVLLSIYWRAFRHSGYFLQNCPTSHYLILTDVHGAVDIAFVKRVIDASVTLGIFDKNLYESCGVLTSPYLQQAYVGKCRSSKRRNITIDERYRLITIEEEKKKVNNRKKIDFNALSRTIVQGWNMAFSARPERAVPDDMQSDPVFIDCLKELVDKYPDYAETDPWFALFRNAVRHHSELHLASIVCDEPVFRTLQHPAPFPNPFSDEGIREALDAPDKNEDSGDEAEITEKQPAEDTRCQTISANPGAQENPNVISVCVANEAPAPSPRKSFENFFAGFPSANIDEEPVQEEPAPTEVKAEVQTPAAEPKPDDPELSALLRTILRLYNEKYREAGYADEYQADEALADDMNAVDLLRTYIGEDARCRNPEFWALLIDGLVHLQGFRSHATPEHIYWLFDPNPDPSAPHYLPLETRKKLLYYHRLYVTDPERSSDPAARQTGPVFVEMKRREGIDPALLMSEARENEPEEPPYPEGITEDQKRLIDALRSNSEIPKGDLGWLEDRIIHPELYKAPDKPYGDRTAPMPWAKKNPPSYEEIVADPKFCHDLSHGSSIRGRE